MFPDFVKKISKCLEPAIASESGQNDAIASESGQNDATAGPRSQVKVTLQGSESGRNDATALDTRYAIRDTQ